MNVLDYAIDMEREGEKYYAEQAQLGKNNAVKEVCLILAKEERLHAQILKNKADQLVYELPGSDSYERIKNLFKDMENFKSEINETPTQFEFYKAALEKEKQSIDLYADFLGKATDPEEQKLFAYLIEQEKSHFALFDELVTMVRHSEEWVESAEFGIRKEDY